MSGDAHGGGGHGSDTGGSIMKWVFIFILILFAINYFGATLQNFGQGGHSSGGSAFMGITGGGAALPIGGGGRQSVTVQHPFAQGIEQYRCRIENGYSVRDPIGTGWCHD